MESLDIGLAVGIAFLTLAVLDWVALSQLPRRRRSFGPVAPTLLVLVPLRAVITIVPVLLPLSPLWIATLVEISNFALTGYVLDSLWGEPFRLTLTRLTLKSPKLRGAPPLRVLHVSDFHVERLTRREEKMVKWINELRPDLDRVHGRSVELLVSGRRTRPRRLPAAADADSRAAGRVCAFPARPSSIRPKCRRRSIRKRRTFIWLKNETIEIEGYPQVQIIGLTCTHDPTLDAPQASIGSAPPCRPRNSRCCCIIRLT